MATNTLPADNPATLVLGLMEAPGPVTATTTGLESLLFGLSLAVALPPTALVSPTDAGNPTVLPSPRPILGDEEIAEIVGSAPIEVGRGRIALGEVDRRLHGLVVVLDLFRIVGITEALVSLGIVRAERAAPATGIAAPADLWRLARETVPQHGVVRDHQVGVRCDSMLIGYGAVTAQMVWLAGDCMASVSVTSLGRESASIADVACSIARRLDSLLARR